MLNAKRLESGSWQDVQALLLAQFSSTTDSGVEAYLHMINTTVADYFPCWQHFVERRGGLGA